MKKRLLLVTILVLALTLAFGFQICTFNRTSRENNIGIVYGANGPIVGAYVSAEPAIEGGSGSSFAITDGSGFYSMTTGLVAGTYNVSAFAEGYIITQVGPVDVVTGQTTPSVNLDLQASGGISGLVTDAVSSNPLGGTSLYASLSNGTTSFGWFGTTGTDGRYLIATNLVTGTYNVSIFSPPDGYISQLTTADVVVGVETKNVDLQLARSGIISGKVAMPNGTGLFGINVYASSSGGGMPYYGLAQTDLSGNYRIATGLGTGDYTVAAVGAGNFTSYGGLTPIMVPVTAGQETTGIDMELTPVTTPPTPSGTITGRVTDQSNNPISSVTVTATGSGGSGFGETDNNGYYNISSDLGTGNDYNVSASATGYNDAYFPSLVSVTIGQVTPDINIQMTAKPAENFGTITGTVTGSSNPIIPEFPYPMIALLTLVTGTAGITTLTLKTLRHKKRDTSS